MRHIHASVDISSNAYMKELDTPAAGSGGGSDSAPGSARSAPSHSFTSGQVTLHDSELMCADAKDLRRVRSVFDESSCSCASEL